MTGLLQKGGSNSKAGSSINFSVGEYSLSSRQLNETIKKHSRIGTNRQMARIIADEVAEIALKLNIFGDLHNQMLLEYPNMTDQEKVWCSNFQTTNLKCPENVRKWLVMNYRSRFKK